MWSTGGRPLEWFIYRYVVRSEAPGVINDPNGWFEDPRDLVAAIERIVYVSVESTRIIEGLPREVTGGVGFFPRAAAGTHRVR